jgi:hypothetical protein
VSADDGGAAGRTQEGGDDLQQGRLAGAVGAEQRDGLAGDHVEVHAIENPLGTEDANETRDANEGYGTHAPSRVILTHCPETVKEAGRRDGRRPT